jgi:hypothetical protein
MADNIIETNDEESEFWINATCCCQESKGCMVLGSPTQLVQYSAKTKSELVEIIHADRWQIADGHTGGSDLKPGESLWLTCAVCDDERYS